MNIWLIVLFLVLGFLVGYFRILPVKYRKWADYISTGGLILLLFSMGAKIGIDDRILSKLDKLGLQALIMAFVSIAGSVFFLKLLSLKIEKREGLSTVGDMANTQEKSNDYAMTLLIIFFVLAGGIFGFFLIPVSFFATLDLITTYALAILLLGVGMDIGRNREVLDQVRKMGLIVIAIPITIAIGSIVGALFGGLIIGLNSNEAAAVGAGFGWYSLSAIILTNIYSAELGSLAFLANIFRELMTFLILPFVVRHFGRLTSIAPGGATTMDVTLPLIRRTAGEEMAIPAFISGIILTFLVPILVPFFINL